MAVKIAGLERQAGAAELVARRAGVRMDEAIAEAADEIAKLTEQKRGEARAAYVQAVDDLENRGRRPGCCRCPA
jgi:hypothetical protein